MRVYFLFVFSADLWYYIKIKHDRRDIVAAAITNMDFAALDFIQNNLRCEFLDVLMKLFTYLGNGGLIWIVLGLALCCVKKYRPCGIAIIAGLLM